MKTFNTKLALSALAIAMLATPALAQQQSHRQRTTSYSAYEGLQNSTAPSTVGVYPNGALRSGSAYSRESGAEDNVIR